MLTGAQATGATSMGLVAAITWLVTFTLTKMAKLGYWTESDATQLGVVLVVIGAAAWGAYINRRTALLQKAGNVVGADGEKTKVLTSPELAQATPSANVVSNLTNKVVSQ